MLMCIQKQEPNDADKTIWYAQVNATYLKDVIQQFKEILRAEWNAGWKWRPMVTRSLY